MRKLIILLSSLLSFFLFSCNNDEGLGGTSVVEGHVYKVIHPDDVYTFKTDTFPAAKEDIYLVYGDESIYGDKMETGFDGFFRFKYLNKGTYYVYAYSTLPDGRKEAVLDTVTVEAGKTSITANIYIHEGKSLLTSYIKGSVLVKYYDKGYVTGLMPAYDVHVYIRTVGSLYQFDDVKTGLDGVFMFQGLDPGEYEVFVYTEQAGEQVLTPIIKNITITEKGVIETIETPFEIIINS